MEVGRVRDPAQQRVVCRSFRAVQCEGVRSFLIQEGVCSGRSLRCVLFCAGAAYWGRLVLVVEVYGIEDGLTFRADLVCCWMPYRWQASVLFLVVNNSLVCAAWSCGNEVLGLEPWVNVFLDFSLQFALF